MFYDILDLGSKNTWSTLLNSNWFYDTLKSTQITLLDFNWFYDKLDLDLKNTWTKLPHPDLFYYNQAGMVLENIWKLTWTIC